MKNDITVDCELTSLEDVKMISLFHHSLYAMRIELFRGLLIAQRRLGLIKNRIEYDITNPHQTMKRVGQSRMVESTQRIARRPDDFSIFEPCCCCIL